MSRSPITTIRSRPAVLLEDHLDTDQIVPARFLTTTERAVLGDALLCDRRFDAAGRERPEFPLNRPEARGAKVLVAGANFGCGSSREHAVWALAEFGFEAVIAPSFADIFRTNAGKNGLLAIQLERREVAACATSVRLTIDLERCEVRLEEGGVFGFAIDPFTRYCLSRGLDELDFLLAATAPGGARAGSSR